MHEQEGGAFGWVLSFYHYTLSCAQMGNAASATVCILDIETKLPSIPNRVIAHESFLFTDP